MESATQTENDHFGSGYATESAVGGGYAKWWLIHSPLNSGYSRSPLCVCVSSFFPFSFPSCTAGNDQQKQNPSFLPSNLRNSSRRTPGTGFINGNRCPSTHPCPDRPTASANSSALSCAGEERLTTNDCLRNASRSTTGNGGRKKGANESTAH